jgi:lipoprotein-releasing system ATP-binding protein
MKSMARKLNQTFIIVTHDKGSFGDVDKVITIQDGKAFKGDKPSEMEILA